MRYLLMDIGSTYTKGTLVDTKRRCVLGHALAITTIESGVIKGVHEMLNRLRNVLSPIETESESALFSSASSNPLPKFWDRALLCSSAAGGLRMVAVGLGRQLTAEAATRAALGAGARILRTYAYELREEDLREIDALRPDILLLSGGTEGGNRVSLMNHAKQLRTLTHRMPIVLAGNSQVAEEAARELSGFDVTLTENVMPQVNVLNADPARQAIRRIFMNHITQVKGLGEVSEQIGPVEMPTPDAVLHAAKLLADGTEKQAGLGDLVIVDIGGATTDIHSIGSGKPTESSISLDGRTSELRVEGLQEPYEKRTVEGDLGMRYSAESLLESVGEEKLQSLYPADYREACRRRAQDIRFLPQAGEERAIDGAMARACAQTALSRHVGTLRRDYEKGRYVYYLSGKDLSSCRWLIGTGGVLVHSESPGSILRPLQQPLFPTHPGLLVDRDYVLSSMGLLSTEEPEAALSILKETLVPVETH